MKLQIHRFHKKKHHIYLINPLIQCVVIWQEVKISLLIVYLSLPLNNLVVYVFICFGLDH